jgi:alkylation response protein AidB-like acyl-CoA dehydrogenase
MRLRYSDEDEAFRDELLAWLAEHPPPTAEERVGRDSSADMPDWARRWQRTLYDGGWLVPGLPPEWGGRNATLVQQMVYFEVFAEREIPRSVNPQGLSIAAASLLDHGTEDQIEQLAVPTLRGELAWCIGMSEPGAGSDLAALSTRAVLDGAEFVVNGQKVWTSGAHHADWCFCYVRTDPAAPKHQGISALLIDMSSPGITCRPLPELTEPDYADFNEVFFEDVRVPAANLVGELNQGWAITQGSLAHERAMLWITNAASLQQSVEWLIALGDRAGPDGRPLKEGGRFRDDVARLYMDGQAAMLIGYRGFALTATGHAAPEHGILKVFTSEAERELDLLAVEALGPDGIDQAIPGRPVVRPGSWADQYLRAFAGTIAGGTSEIQRNIIAERILGLPRGPSA